MSQYSGRSVFIVRSPIEAFNASATREFRHPKPPFPRSLVALALLVACSGGAPTVEGITLANNTGYDLEVEVTSQDRVGWLPLAIVEARSEAVTQEVIDQGKVWIFRFVHWGEPVGELRLARAELEGNAWRVEVPAEVEERLQELGRPMFGELVEPEAGGGG
jgi:hypothetical protein